MLALTLIRKVFVLSLILAACLSVTALAQKKKKTTKPVIAGGTPILWRDPGDISALDLSHGPGSPELAPVPPFTFLKQDMVGASPKIQVRDAKGVRWSVKLGVESQSEQVATRLVWAMGYFAEEGYYFDRVNKSRRSRRVRNSSRVIVRRASLAEGEASTRGHLGLAAKSVRRDARARRVEGAHGPARQL